MPKINIERKETDVVTYCLDISDGNLCRLLDNKYRLTDDQKQELLDKLFEEQYVEPSAQEPIDVDEWMDWYEV